MAEHCGFCQTCIWADMTGTPLIKVVCDNKPKKRQKTIIEKIETILTYGYLYLQTAFTAEEEPEFISFDEPIDTPEEPMEMYCLLCEGGMCKNDYCYYCTACDNVN